MYTGKQIDSSLNIMDKKERMKRMRKIAVFFGEGYEEIEALTVVDICQIGRAHV